MLTQDLRPLPSSTASRLPNHAAQLWQGVLQRQGLAGGSKIESAVGVAEATLGLHAARLPTPFATLVSRLRDQAIAGTILHPREPVGLTTIRCMRKTLHALPPRLAQIAHLATRHFRERDAIRLAYNAGIGQVELDRAVNEIVDMLVCSGPLPHRKIESAVVGSVRGVASVRVALKAAWEKGLITYINRSQYWNREHRHFAATSQTFPDFASEGDREAAASELIVEYFDRYGPATIRDAVWWSGLSQARVRSALIGSGREVLTIVSPWSVSDMYVFADHISLPPEPRLTVDFLAHEDVALKAYFETRGRYLGKWPQKLIYNQIGEVRPSILLNGELIGEWKWSARDRSVSWQAFGRLGVAIRKLCDERAAELTLILRAHHSEGNRS